MATCLITGGAGNLACQLTWPLAEMFDRVVLFDVAAEPLGRHLRDAIERAGPLRLPITISRHAPAGALLAAPGAALTRRVYNIDGFTTTPGEIAAAIRGQVPEAVLEFAPDDAIDGVLAAWPGAIDDATARRDWQWRPEWDLARTAADFMAALRAEPEATS